MRMRFAFVALMSVIPALHGCHGAAGPRLLSLVGLAQKPIVLTHIVPYDKPAEGLVQLVNPFSRYAALNERMSRALNRPVVEDLCLPFQLSPNLQLGVAHLAMISPADFAALAEGSFYPLAISADERGVVASRAKLIIPAGSKIHAVTDLRRRVVAFGPSQDARTHTGGLMLLAEHGVARTDLALEALPTLGSLKSFPDSKDVAQSVLNGSSDAGFVDERYWNALPEHEPDRTRPAKDRFLVLAETEAYPDLIVVASRVLTESERSDIQRFLVDSDEIDSDALRPLKVGSFAPPAEDVLRTCRKLGALTPAAQMPESPAASQRTSDGP